MVGARGSAGRHCAAAPAGVRRLATEVGHVPRHQVSKIEGDGEMLTGLWKKEKNGRRVFSGVDRRRRGTGLASEVEEGARRAPGRLRSTRGAPAAAAEGSAWPEMRRRRGIVGRRCLPVAATCCSGEQSPCRARGRGRGGRLQANSSSVRCSSMAQGPELTFAVAGSWRRECSARRSKARRAG